MPTDPARATIVEVSADYAGQRLDNFLLRELKGVPKTYIYRVVRSGEVRVNSGRVDASYKLAAGDRVRIPPVRTSVRPVAQSGATQRRVTSFDILYEDDSLLAINKPAGWAVHGGSGIAQGVIEALRVKHGEARFLELVHRLDRETSGVLLIAKTRPALLAMHRDLASGEGFDKRYLVCVKGRFRNEKQRVSLNLAKYVTREGERRVSVDHDDGRVSETIFYRRERFADATLLEAELLTGRTHQIRVHLAHVKHPILGDDKYGDFALNKSLASQGLKRMFLHAASISFKHPETGRTLRLEAPLPAELERYLERLRTASAESAQAAS